MENFNSLNRSAFESYIINELPKFLSEKIPGFERIYHHQIVILPVLINEENFIYSGERLSFKDAQVKIMRTTKKGFKKHSDYQIDFEELTFQFQNEELKFKLTKANGIKITEIEKFHEK